VAVIRQTKTATLFRCLVTPALLVCAIFRKPLFQWLALGAATIWLIVAIAESIGKRHRRKKQTKAVKQLAAISAPLDDNQENSMSPTSENELFLIRQINYRITEQLKESYPMIAWLWVNRPATAELCNGGTWRIRLTNAEPFNYGEVEISKTGQLTIILLQAIALKEAKVTPVESFDLSQDEILDRPDVKAWYREHGEKLIAEMIDDLNTQGHKKLLVKDDGTVVIETAGTEQYVDSLRDFPPRLAWPDFCQLLSEDEIQASVKPEGLQLAW